MYAKNLPEAWEIAEMERRRRIRETETGERATIPLPLPPPMHPPRDRREPGEGSRVIVIDLC